MWQLTQSRHFVALYTSFHCYTCLEAKQKVTMKVNHCIDRHVSKYSRALVSTMSNLYSYYIS